jgi:soluble lytic murein transglycosylase-like protein
VDFEGNHIGQVFGANAASSRANTRLTSLAAASLGTITKCALVCFMLIATPAAADVFEIAPDGEVTVRQKAGAAIWDAASPETALPEQQDIKADIPVQRIGLHSNTVPQRFAASMQAAAASASLSPALLAALVSQESGWNPRAVSSKGAVGLAQLMPATARELGVDPRDPAANLLGGALYLRRLLDSFGGDVERALAAYNAGPGRVRRANGVPAIAETQAYVRSIVGRVTSFNKEVM